ncbi:MAG: hypothetical protein JJU36_05035 [Phycisphaeraceae bacterium]|nr:hypothetical protein [Phycisphaeraceae bacterium]
MSVIFNLRHVLGLDVLVGLEPQLGLCGVGLDLRRSLRCLPRRFGMASGSRFWRDRQRQGVLPERLDIGAGDDLAQFRADGLSIDRAGVLLDGRAYEACHGRAVQQGSALLGCGAVAWMSQGD